MPRPATQLKHQLLFGMGVNSCLDRSTPPGSFGVVTAVGMCEQTYLGAMWGQHCDANALYLAEGQSVRERQIANLSVLCVGLLLRTYVALLCASMPLPHNVVF